MKKTLTIIALALSATAFGQMENGGMETWRTYSAGTASSLTSPTGWNAGDSIVFAMGPILCATCTFQQQTFKNDTPHSGTWAAKLMSRDMGGSLGVAEAQLANCQINVSLSTFTETLSGGAPTTSQVDSVTVWIKYVPQGGDSGKVNVTAVLMGASADGTDSIVGHGQDVTVAMGDNYVLATPTYTKHTYVITYGPSTAIPDHIQVDFHTSFMGLLNDNTTMYVDDVAMYPHVGTKVQLMHSNGVVCYPNPVGNTLHIQTADHENTVAELYNILGQRVATQPLNDYITEMNISGLSVGVYYLQLLGANNEVSYNTQIVKQ